MSLALGQLAPSQRNPLCHSLLRLKLLHPSPLVHNLQVHGPLRLNLLRPSPLVRSLLVHSPLRLNLLRPSTLVRSLLVHSQLVHNLQVHNLQVHSPLRLNLLHPSPLVRSMLVHSPLVLNLLVHSPLVHSPLRLDLLRPSPLVRSLLVHSPLRLNLLRPSPLNLSPSHLSPLHLGPLHLNLLRPGPLDLGPPHLSLLRRSALPHSQLHLRTLQCLCGALRPTATGNHQSSAPRNVARPNAESPPSRSGATAAQGDYTPPPTPRREANETDQCFEDDGSEFDPDQWEQENGVDEAGYVVRPPCFASHPDTMPSKQEFPELWHEISDPIDAKRKWGLLKGKVRKNSLAFEVPSGQGSRFMLFPPGPYKYVSQMYSQKKGKQVAEVPYGDQTELFGLDLAKAPPHQLCFSVGKGLEKKGDTFLIWYAPEEIWFTKSEFGIGRGSGPEATVLRKTLSHLPRPRHSHRVRYHGAKGIGRRVKGTAKGSAELHQGIFRPMQPRLSH
ncbi:hypothetical protein V2A60_003794 [Cordyceps javanica]